MKSRIIFYTLAAAVLSISLFGLVSSKVNAVTTEDTDCYTDYYINNNITFYNPCAKPIACTLNASSIDITGSSENAEAIFKYLISAPLSTNDNKPLNPVQAAGFLGNFYQESKYNPKIIQGGKPYDEARAKNSSVGGYAFGLVQWDSGRRVNLLEFAASNNKQWDDLLLQLDFIKHELETSESRIIRNSEFKTTTDVNKATELVMTLYERPGDRKLENRQAAAKIAYDKYKNLSAGVISSSSGQCDPVGSGSNNGDIAQTAINLSWSSRSSEGSRDHTALQAKQEYVAALQATGVNKLGDTCSKNGASCDAFLATVLRYSGVDPNFPCCGANNQNNYMKNNPNLYEQVYTNISKGFDISKLMPGDLMWRSGHVKIYIGDGREAAASHCERTAEQSKLYLDGSYTVYRVKRGTATSL